MIGEHSVVIIPDPNVPAWSAPLASNPYFTNDLTGWDTDPFIPPAWKWDPSGKAVWDAAIGGTWGPQMARTANAPVPRDLSTAYRVRARVRTDGVGWLIPGLRFGLTAQNASDGPFWAGDACQSREQWISVGTPQPTDYVVEITVDATTVPSGYAFLAPAIGFYGDTLPGVFSIDSLELVGQVVAGSDVSCYVDTVSIEHGRADVTGQPEASTATVDLSFDTGAADFPAGMDVGSILRVATTLGDTTSIRFTGVITDIALGWDDRGEDSPNAVVAQVVAASALASLGRRVVGDEPWPQELDGARVSRVLTLAGFTVDPTTSDPGVVSLIPRDVDKRPALELAQEAATSASGIVWQTRDGDVRYADSEHRRRASTSLNLDACDVLITPQWIRDTDGLINDVSIGYGVAADESEQPRWDQTNAASQTRFGRYEISVATLLAALADAQAMAALLLARNSSPVWVLADLPVDVAGLDADRTSVLLGLNMHDLIGLTGLPVVGSLPTSASLWVEGWSESLTHGTHELSLHVSGYCRTSPPPRWDDVPSGWTWDTRPPSLTWDTAACFGPTPSAGRWADVPASTRWDTTPAAITWNTWPY